MVQDEEVEGRRPRLRLDSDQILLVEGKDEVNLLHALIRHRLPAAESDIQVIDAGGRDQFPSRLKAIRVAAQTRPTLRSIGVVRDADDNPEGAFQSVCNHLEKAEFPVPEHHASHSGGVPSVGVFVVPDGLESGAIETLCRRSVESSDTARCVELYLDCLEKCSALESRSLDKSFTHAYLAAARDPVARVGEGARKGAWNLDSRAFDELVDFLSVCFGAS